MYVPSMFSAKSLKDVEAYMKKNSFATLISQGAGGRPIGTHIPLQYVEKRGKEFLYGHIAKANQQKLSFDEDQNLLAIFMETHAYISSSWYDHINVPTWNYIAVHVYGKARIITGKELYESIDNLVNEYESDRPNRFHLTDFDEEQLDAHLNGLVGFEMSVDQVEASYKLSQNRKDEDYFEIVKQLEATGDALSIHIADEMKKNRE